MNGTGRTFRVNDRYNAQFFDLQNSLWYNVNGGSLNRGQLTVIAYKYLADKSEMTAENLRLAQYVGWMSEMLEAALFMVDDMIDRSQTRRSLPCWYTLPDVENQSIFDALVIENATFLGLKTFIGHKDYYPRIFRIFSETMFCTCLGQTVDMQIKQDCVLNHTMNQFESVTKYATAYPGAYMPLAVALEMCGYKDSQIYEDCKIATLAFGLFWQSRNDYEDCFGLFAETGKHGNDIEENRISWMGVNAVAQADERQREILRNCYGKKDPEKVAQILTLYKEMGIDRKYLQHKEDSYAKVRKIIENLNCDKIKPLLQIIWDKIYYKNKQLK